MISKFETEQIARAVSQVAFAKELAMLELANTANALVRAKGSEESIVVALDPDRAWRAQTAKELIDGTVRVERDYRWTSRVKIADKQTATGIRFVGSLPADGIEDLAKSKSPSAFGESNHDQSRRQVWRVESGDMSVSPSALRAGRYLVLQSSKTEHGQLQSGQWRVVAAFA